MAILCFVGLATIYVAVTSLVVAGLDLVATWKSEAAAVARTRTTTLEAVQRIDSFARAQETALYETLARARGGRR